MTTTTPIHELGRKAVAFLQESGAPKTILDAVTHADAHTVLRDGKLSYPPRPGCRSPEGLGEVDLCGAFDLRQWQQELPHLMTDEPDVVDTLIEVEKILRTAGEGSKVIWSIAIMRPSDLIGGWPHPHPLWITDLDHYGPRLDMATLNQVTEMLATVSWGLVHVNGRGMVHNCPCFTTAWWSGV